MTTTEHENFWINSFQKHGLWNQVLLDTFLQFGLKTSVPTIKNRLKKRFLKEERNFDEWEIQYKKPRENWNREMSDEVLNNFYEIVDNQLNEYKKTGKRVCTIELAGLRVGISEASARKYAQMYLTSKYGNNAQTVYDMIFGNVLIFYQEVMRRCNEAGFILLTTKKEWFSLIRNRGDIPVWKLKVEVQCQSPDKHITWKVISLIGNKGCYDCMIDIWKKEALSFEDAVDLAEARGLELVSLYNPNAYLTELEFTNIINKFKLDHLGVPRDKFGGKTVNINLRWRHPECDYVFEKTYYNIRRGKTGCPLCFSNVDQTITFKIVCYLFGDYSHITSFQVDAPLYQIIPSEILNKVEYQCIQHHNVHVDIFTLLTINGIEVYLAVEHQGAQHNPDPNIGFIEFKAIKKFYKQIANYNDWLSLIERDQTKVELFNELKNRNYYLIVVPNTISPPSRFNYILKQFQLQTGIYIPPKSAVDWRELTFQ